MTEKHFCLSTFFVIKYFRFYCIFYVKTAKPLNKVSPLFLSNLPLKIEVLSSLPPFWKFGRRVKTPSPSHPSSGRGGEGGVCALCLICSYVRVWKTPCIFMFNGQICFCSLPLHGSLVTKQWIFCFQSCFWLLLLK